MTDKKLPGITWDSFVEQLIREAQLTGAFDNLPGFGQPLPGIDEPYDEMWWLKKKLQRENISFLPPALQIRVDVHQTLEAAWKLATEADVRQSILELNERIRRATFAVSWGPSTTTTPLDVEQVVREWHTRKTQATNNS